MEAPDHQPAAAALRSLAQGRTRWAIPFHCLVEFLNVVTHPRIFRTPTPTEGALDQVRAWMESPSLSLLANDTTLWPVLEEVVRVAGVAGPKVHDARIAATCLHHGVRELWSVDRDFSRFPALRVRNPLPEFEEIDRGGVGHGEGPPRPSRTGS